MDAGMSMYRCGDLSVFFVHIGLFHQEFYLPHAFDGRRSAFMVAYRPIVTTQYLLFRRMYRAPSVMRERARVTAVVQELFPLYMARPELRPREWRADVAQAGSETDLARIVLDYVAGMTDRFAIQEHARLLG